MITAGENGEYTLYHKNTHGNTNWYHFQTKRYTDVMDVLDYIVQHDNYRLDNPLPEDRESKKKSAPHTCEFCEILKIINLFLCFSHK